MKLDELRQKLQQEQENKEKKVTPKVLNVSPLDAFLQALKVLGPAFANYVDVAIKFKKHSAAHRPYMCSSRTCTARPEGCSNASKLIVIVSSSFRDLPQDLFARHLIELVPCPITTHSRDVRSVALFVDSHDGRVKGVVQA